MRLVPEGSDDAAAQAVADGHAAFGTARLSGHFLTFAAAHDLRIVAPEFSDHTGIPSTLLVVSARARKAGLTGPAGLAHRRIGLTALDSPKRFALTEAAARYGVAADALQLVEEKDPNTLRADLASGALDAALVPTVTARAWRREVGGFSIIRISDFVQWQDGVIFARADTLQQHADLMAAFMRAYVAALADYNLTFQQRDDGGTALPGAHFGRYLEAIAAQTHVAAAEAAYALPFCDPLARLDLVDLGRQLAFWQAQGVVGRQVTVGVIANASANPNHF